MINKIILPKLAANMEKGIIGKWLKKEGERVEKGELLFELSTDKAVFEVEAEESGILRKIFKKEGEEVPILAVIGIIAGENEELLAIEELMKSPYSDFSGEKKSGFIKKEDKLKVCPIEIKKDIVGISPRAKKLAEEHNLDISLIKPNRERICEEDVKNYLFNKKERVLIIGGLKGGMMAVDIVNQDSNKIAAGILDDNSELWGREINEVKVLGPIKMIDQLKDKFDSLIIAIAGDIEIRKRLFLEYKNKGYKFINLIHPQVLVEKTAGLGTGNIIYPFVRIGPYSKIGDNNLLSAFCNIEHHNEVGSHNTFGPHCSTSGGVKIEDCCKFGTGIFIENDITIGSNSLIASGSIILNDIPANSFLRAKVVQKPESRNI